MSDVARECGGGPQVILTEDRLASKAFGPHTSFEKLRRSANKTAVLGGLLCSTSILYMKLNISFLDPTECFADHNLDRLPIPATIRTRVLPFVPVSSPLECT